jgi:hypothetical protein
MKEATGNELKIDIEIPILMKKSKKPFLACKRRMEIGKWVPKIRC